MKVKISQRVLLQLVNRVDYLVLQPQSSSRSTIYYREKGTIWDHYPILLYNSDLEELGFWVSLPDVLARLATHVLEMAEEFEEKWKDTKAFHDDLDEFLAKRKETRDKKRRKK